MAIQVGGGQKGSVFGLPTESGGTLNCSFYGFLIKQRNSQGTSSLEGSEPAQHTEG